MDTPLQMFTATQIARGLGVTRQAAQRILAGISPAGEAVTHGNVAKAWTLATLPAPWQLKLQNQAGKLGYRNAEQLLSAPPRRWEPPIPLGEVAQDSLERAAKLQRALRRVLSQTDPAYTAAHRDRDGIADYQREFGHSITTRHLHDLVNRTLERDGGAEDLERVELYLDERPARRQRIRQPSVTKFPDLQEAIASFKNSAAPTEAETDYLWIRTFERFDTEVGAGAPAKRIKSRLIRFLVNTAPFSGVSAEAIRKAFGRRYKRWSEAGRNVEALQDGRKVNSGFHRAPELTGADRDAIIAHAVLNCDGRVSQAWRELTAQSALSEPLLSYYQHNPASKSHCPKRIRESVKFEVEMQEDIHHGPRQAKLNGAHINRDWSGVASMDWLCADDVTLEVYFYVPDGKGWFSLMRGQCLVMIDVRTLRVLGFGLRPEKSYNAAMIRTLITRVCDDHGLPRKGFYFERGIWASSRLLKGNPSEDDPFSWGETELGLRSLGLRFMHSQLPRSKPVERVIGALQDLMEGEPGYVGPDEKREKFERIQKKKLEVDAHKLNPAEHFHSLDQWIDRIEAICNQYNATVQNGKMTCGLSPDEAFAKFTRTDDPVTKLPPTCRYLLAHHKRPIKVTSNGITLRFGNQAFNYRNEETGKLIGQTVLTWFNPDLPEILTVTDMKRENAFAIEISPAVPAMDATSEQLEQAFSKIAAHQSYARIRYRTLRAKHTAPFRHPIVDSATAELGREMAAATERIRFEQSQDARQETKARKAYVRLGMTPPPGVARRAGQMEAVERLAVLMEKGETNE
jgi:hypothetical protein